MSEFVWILFFLKYIYEILAEYRTLDCETFTVAQPGVFRK